jgi:hypothetical protein
LHFTKILNSHKYSISESTISSKRITEVRAAMQRVRANYGVTPRRFPANRHEKVETAKNSHHHHATLPTTQRASLINLFLFLLNLRTK